MADRRTFHQRSRDRHATRRSPTRAPRPGSLTLSGTFAWKDLPDSISLPRQHGLLRLTVDGATVAQPLIDGDVVARKAAGAGDDVPNDADGACLSTAQRWRADDARRLMSISRSPAAIASSRCTARCPKALYRLESTVTSRRVSSPTATQGAGRTGRMARASVQSRARCSRRVQSGARERAIGRPRKSGDSTPIARCVRQRRGRDADRPQPDRCAVQGSASVCRYGNQRLELIEQFRGDPNPSPNEFSLARSSGFRLMVRATRCWTRSTASRETDPPGGPVHSRPGHRRRYTGTDHRLGDAQPGSNWAAVAPDRCEPAKFTRAGSTRLSAGIPTLRDCRANCICRRAGACCGRAAWTARRPRGYRPGLSGISSSSSSHRARAATARPRRRDTRRDHARGRVSGTQRADADWIAAVAAWRVARRPRTLRPVRAPQLSRCTGSTVSRCSGSRSTASGWRLYPQLENDGIDHDFAPPLPSATAPMMDEGKIAERGDRPRESYAVSKSTSSERTKRTPRCRRAPAYRRGAGATRR